MSLSLTSPPVPSGSLPSSGFNPLKPLTQWLTDVYPTLSSSEKPLEITQEEGQVLYIPEGWYRASFPTTTTSPNTRDPRDVSSSSPTASATLPAEQQPKTSLALYSLLANCGRHNVTPQHSGGHNHSMTDSMQTVKHAALSLHQQAAAPEVVHSEYYLTQRGLKLLAQGQIGAAIDTLLQGVGLGAAAAGGDVVGRSGVYSPHNSFILLHTLGEAYSAAGDISAAEEAFVYAISLNRWGESSMIVQLLMCMTYVASRRHHHHHHHHNTSLLLPHGAHLVQTGPFLPHFPCPPLPSARHELYDPRSFDRHAKAKPYPPRSLHVHVPQPV